MSNALITKLRLLTALDEDELGAVARACAETRSYRPREDIVAERQRLDSLHILVDGWACRYKLLGDGRRQLPAILVAGDTCDLDGLLVERLDYSVSAISACTVAVLPHEAARRLFDRYPAVRDAFWWLTFVENAVATEWAVCLGRRTARERLAHLLCELLVRLAVVERADANSFGLPLTQDQIADFLGLTPVHVNRVLQGLRADGIITLKDHRLRIHDWARLKRIAAFDARYLHLEGLRSSVRPSAAGARTNSRLRELSLT